MGAKPLTVPFVAALLASAALAGSLAVAPRPAAAQTVIGGAGNNVQVNLDALNQLGGAGSPAGTAGTSAGYPAISGRAPLPGEAPPPKPLLGETGIPASPPAVLVRPELPPLRQLPLPRRPPPHGRLPRPARRSRRQIRP